MATIKLGKKQETQQEDVRTEKVPVKTEELAQKHGKPHAKKRLRETVRKDRVLRNSAIMFEEKENRTVNGKEFRNNDGTVTQIISPYSTHYKAEGEEELREIDTTLIDAGDRFETKEGKYKISIAKDTERDGTLKLSNEHFGIEWNFLPEEGVRSDLQQISTFCEDGGEKNAVATVYENAAADTDLEYEVLGNNVKENIIVRQRQEEYSYRFQLKLTGAYVRLSEDTMKIEIVRKAENGEIIKEAEIPAPYMYDAKGDISENIYYEMEESGNGVYRFVIHADSEWINAEEREFPVVIDPRIVTEDENFFTAETKGRSYTSTSEGGSWSDWRTSSSQDIIMQNNSYYETYTKIYIDFSKLPQKSYKIASAKLLLTASAYTGTFYANGVEYFVNKYFETVAVDITSCIQNNTAIKLTGKFMVFYKTGINAPKLEIEYFTNDSVKQTVKEVSLAGGVNAQISAYSGDAIFNFNDVPQSDSLLNVGISHMYKLSNDAFGCGKNFRLNLHEKLIANVNNKIDISYIYTDQMGMRHGFKDNYYYLDEQNHKVVVDKSNVSIDTEGNLTYKEHSILKEQFTESGLKAVTRAESFKGIKYFEQRADEQKQVEEQILSYKNALGNYVIITETASNVTKLSNCIGDTAAFEKFIDSIYGPHHLMMESEAENFKSLLLQETSLKNQLYSLNEQNNALNRQETSLQHQIESYDDVIGHRGKEDDYHTKMSDEQYQIQRNLRDDCYAEKYAISIQRIVVDKSIKLCNEQITLTQNQIKQLKENSEKYKLIINQYYKEYVNLLAKKKQYDEQLPVNYLTDGTTTKGFNASGRLVAIFDGYENVISVEYYSDGRVKRVYEGENEQIQFNYNYYNLLTSITDTRGRTINYTYDGSDSSARLTEVSYYNGKTVHFTYDSADNIVKIECSDGSVSEMQYDGAIISLSNATTVEGIEHGKVTHREDGANPLSSLAFDYIGNDKTVITDEKGNRAIYLFGEDLNLAEYYEEVNSVVTKAEKYEYKAYSHEHTESAKKELLNKTAYESFVYAKGDEEHTVFDADFNLPVLKTTSAQKISEGATVSSSTAYEYTDDHQCAKEVQTLTYALPSGQKTVKKITEYSYNPFGYLVRQESYIEGEESTAGKQVEERVYDEKGHVTKSFTYNTLDSSSKLYTESVYSENGQVIAEKDETGEIDVEYEYIDGTTVVRTQKYPNGSKFAYGHDIDDTVTAITQSTAEGEENSTQIYYTNGEVTKLKSGNNVVEYAYDELRRKTKIFFNDTSTYETYEYGEGEAEDWQTATNAKGESLRTVSDKKGNILRTYYGETLQAQYTYDEENRVLTQSDGVTGEVSQISYHASGNVSSYTRGEYSESAQYDEYGNAVTVTKNGREYTYTYKKNAARELESVSVDGFTVTLEKDVLGRSTGKVISTGSGDLAGEYVYYRKVGDHATNMPSAVYFGGMKNGKYAISDHVKYEYDKCGNIAKIFENGALSVRYGYDSIDRLIREDNKALKSTTLYTYDNCGNILCKRQTAFTLRENVEECEFTEVRYAYEGDKLLSYGEESCKYDTIGNATVYRGKVAKYGKGRQLQEYNGVNFSYDGQGRRIGKNGITYTYDGNGNLISDSNGLEYLYDHAGIFAVKYQNATYFYRKDVQGNILALLDESGAVVVQYKYDAWGNHAVLDGAGNDISEDDTHIGYLNPFRYRGYFYDTETELYYLQTRYYDPEVGRFITIDGVEYLDPETINGLNLYAYCGNNPVMRTDPNGNAWWHWLIGALVVVFVTALTVVTAGAAAAAVGTALGVGTSLVSATVTGTAIGGIVAGGIELISQGISSNWTTVDFGALAIESFTGAAYGAVVGMMGSTTSAGLRLGLRAGIVATSCINSILHGINDRKSFANIMADVGISFATSILIQGVMIGWDAKVGKLSSSVLEQFAMDGFLFTARNVISIGIISAIKNIWRNRKRLSNLIVG